MFLKGSLCFKGLSNFARYSWECSDKRQAREGEREREKVNLEIRFRNLLIHGSRAKIELRLRFSSSGRMYITAGIIESDGSFRRD